MLKQIKKSALMLLALTIGLAAVFTVLMVAVFAIIPDEKVEENAKASLILIENETKSSYSELEGVLLLVMPTDMNISRSKYTNGKFRSFNAAEALMFALAADGNFSILGEFPEGYLENEIMVDYANGDPQSTLWKALTPSYARFWHGYIVLLRPLLVFGNMAFIRNGNFIAMLLCFVVLLILLLKIFTPGVTIILTFALATVQAFFVPYNLNYSIAFYIAVIFSIIMLKKYDAIVQKKWLMYFFFIAGSTANFFDVGVTTPLLSLLFPLSFYFILGLQKEIFLPKEDLIDMLKSVFGWGIGYGIIWLLKWSISSLVFGQNVFLEVTKSFVKRVGTHSSSGQDNYGRLNSILYILEDFSPNYKIWSIFILIALAILIIWNIYIKKQRGAFFLKALPLVAIAIAPLMWYFLLCNHSVEHSTLMTYRLLSATLFALGCLFIYLYKGSIGLIASDKQKALIEPGVNPYKAVKKTNSKKKKSLL